MKAVVITEEQCKAVICALYQIEESNSLFAAMLHETRPQSEIEEQILENRLALTLALAVVRTLIPSDPVVYMGTDQEGSPNKFRLNSFNVSTPLYARL